MKLRNDGLTLSTVENDDIHEDGAFNFPTGPIYIGFYAFENCSSLKSILLPHDILAIGDSAFTGCYNLTSINFPDNIKRINGSAFRNCSRLTSITLPDTVKYIGESAFRGCSSLTSISLPNRITDIENSTFYGCTNLTTMTLPGSVREIGNWAFSNCSRLTIITLPEKITYIGSGAFSSCSRLKTIIINTDNDDVVEQIKRLLPVEHKSKVIKKTIYDEAYRIRKALIASFLEIPQLNPLYKERDFINPVLPDDALIKISSFLAENDEAHHPLFKNVRKKIGLVKLPQSEDELPPYQESLSNVVNSCRSIAKEKIRTSVKHQKIVNGYDRSNRQQTEVITGAALQQLDCFFSNENISSESKESGSDSQITMPKLR